MYGSHIIISLGSTPISLFTYMPIYNVAINWHISQKYEIKPSPTPSSQDENFPHNTHYF